MRKRFTLLFAFVYVIAFASSNDEKVERLQLSDTHATILKFNNDIKYVDFGSGAISGERLSSDRMLKLTGKKPDFAESTISIVTSDGGYHQFSVSYASAPMEYVWQEEGHSFKCDSIGFSSQMTTHFICEEKITDIVIGSPVVIAGYAEKIDNIIKAKSTSLDFKETNIHFVTQSGYIYTFIVKPENSPSKLSVRLSSEEEITRSSQAIFTSNSINDKQMMSFAKKITEAKPSINDIGAVSLKMALAMSAIYSYSDLLAFRLDIQNSGKIDYEIDFIKCYIEDNSKSKTAAMQQEEQTPVYVYYSKPSEKNLLKAGENESIVLFFTRFTLPKHRILYFEMFEKNGGRHLSFPVSAKEILKAKAFVK